MSDQDQSLFVIYTQYQGTEGIHKGKWFPNHDRTIDRMTDGGARKLAEKKLKEARKPYETYGGLISFGSNNVRRRARILKVCEEIFIE